MKKILLAAVGLLVLGAAPALAADLPVKAKPVPVVPVWNWSGFYIGFNGGGASANDCWNLTRPIAFGDGCHDAAGGVVGGQIGYRWQWASNWVFGLEAQGDWAGLKGQSFGLVGVPVPGLFLNNQTKIDGLGLFTGQIGYAFNGWATNSVLLYVKGGGAVVDDRYNGNIPLLLTNLDTTRETRWGGTVGAGVELGFAPGWSVAIEYDHIFLGTNNNTFTFSPAANALGLVGLSRTESIRQDIDMATARVNYTFNWGGPVVAKY